MYGYGGMIHCHWFRVEGRPIRLKKIIAVSKISPSDLSRAMLPVLTRSIA